MIYDLRLDHSVLQRIPRVVSTMIPAGVKRIFDLPFASLNAREVFRHRSTEEMVANIEFPQNHRRASSRMVSSLILFRRLVQGD